MERIRESAAGWVHIGRTSLPKNNHPVPKVGEYIEVTVNKYLQRERHLIGIPAGTYFVQSITDCLIVCTKYYETNYKVVETFHISDFRNGLCLYSVVNDYTELKNCTVV